MTGKKTQKPWTHKTHEYFKTGKLALLEKQVFLVYWDERLVHCATEPVTPVPLVKPVPIKKCQDQYQAEAGVHDPERLRLGIVLQNPDTSVVLAEAVGQPDHDSAHLVDVGERGCSHGFGPGAAKEVQVGQDAVEEKLPLLVFRQEAKVNAGDIWQLLGGLALTTIVEGVEDLDDAGIVV